MCESTPPHSARRGSVLVIALFVILVGVLICIFVVSWIGGPPSKTPFGLEGPSAGPEGPFNQVANAFQLDLEGGRIEAAYARTSKAFQQLQPLNQFRDLMTKNPFPGYPGSTGTSHGEDAARGVWTYRFHASGPGGKLAFTFEVGKEGGEFRVTSFAIQ